MTRTDRGPEKLVRDLVAGERRALAQALTRLEKAGQAGAELLAALTPHLRGAPVAGFTGPPGAGKSTLVNALIAEERRKGRRIGVIAVDPSSPVSGGAILGDRVRMSAARDDDGVFVRSLAARGALGGLSPAAVRMLDGMDAAGFDLILLETVGTGQSEIDVAGIADVRIVLSAPGLGDEMQAMKSGLLEIADVLVVNKADRPGARATALQLEGAVAHRLAEGRGVPVLLTDALGGAGVAELASRIEALGAAAVASGVEVRRRRRARYLIAAAARDLVAARLAGSTDHRLEALCDDVLAGRRMASEAASELLAE